MHARFYHAFSTEGTAGSFDADETSVRVRRNSTSSHVSSSPKALDVPLPPPLQESIRPGQPTVSDLTDPAAPQSVTEPSLESEPSVELLAWWEKLKNASLKASRDDALAAIQEFRAQPAANTACYNMCMHIALRRRAAGQPITLVLELYNEMLARSLLPNTKTYRTLIDALCTRDHEVARVVTSLEGRVKRRVLTDRQGAPANEVDETRLAKLRAENNLVSAISMFSALTTISNAPLGVALYNKLLRSCAFHGDVDGAIRVYGHMERFPNEPPSATTFFHMLSVYNKATELRGAQEVFKEFREAAREGRMLWDNPPTPESDVAPNARSRGDVVDQILVWNKMIETYFSCGEPAAALGLFEKMLDAPPSATFAPDAVPPPNAVTYTTIIVGFCRVNDWTSALSWFDRLANQASIAADPFMPLSSPPRPEQLAWIHMTECLARNNVLDDLNRLFSRWQQIAQQDKLYIRTADRHLVFRQNMNEIDSPNVTPERAASLLDFTCREVMVFDQPAGAMALSTNLAREMLTETVSASAGSGRFEDALALTEQYVTAEAKQIEDSQAKGELSEEAILFNSKGSRSMIQTLSPLLLRMNPEADNLPVSLAMRVAKISDLVGLHIRTLAAWYVHWYQESKRLGHVVDLPTEAWERLCIVHSCLEMPNIEHSAEELVETNRAPSNFAFSGLSALLSDLATHAVSVQQFSPKTKRLAVRALIHNRGSEGTGDYLKSLGVQFEEWLLLPDTGYFEGSGGVQSGSTVPEDIDSAKSKVQTYAHVDLYHSRFVGEWYPTHPSVTPQMAYERFESGLLRGVYPTPESIGQLIGGLGRHKEIAKVRTLYDNAQIVLAVLSEQKQWQSAGWFIVEDNMIIAYAHAGLPDAAHVHRMRILEHGGTPSADAYGALINSLKDTTDDSTYALQLWEEALARNVTPNIFMYNTIISKLAKVRKADHALEIFQAMKMQNVKPTSVTYGALIGACCRVGDSQSAEYLFQEMSNARNFKPRIPPYNTMIQLYTYTKPNRERVLYYFDSLLQAKIQPTAHTYKLLLDAYGTIQPVDLNAMDVMFSKLSKNRFVGVQGTHWASIINAYGCVNKDLDKAVTIFDGITKHRESKGIQSIEPVVYEALFTVFALHRRADLVRPYWEQMLKSKHRPTAYVYNAAIKCYAAADDLDTARALFEQMEDPPAGVAAPHNHDVNQGSLGSDASLPVYREPSSWETMVRAELGVNNREGALDLVRRMELRAYPHAVVHRVKDIMHSDYFPEVLTPSTSVGSGSSESF